MDYPACTYRTEAWDGGKFLNRGARNFLQGIETVFHQDLCGSRADARDIGNSCFHFYLLRRMYVLTR